MSGYTKRVRNLAVSVYNLIPSTSEQLELFASPTHAVSEASDKINGKWGEFVITPALMLGMEDIILDRISFGGVKELEEIYSDSTLAIQESTLYRPGKSGQAPSGHY